jgi:hypothetical protein
MAIKASAAADVRQLIAALGRDDEVARESAIARLAILGDRAVDRLIAALPTAGRTGRIGILRALEAGADDRALPAAREALRDGGDVGLAAIGVLRSLLDSRHAATSAAALDTLMATVLDDSTEHRLRHAAAEALESVPALRDQVAAALAGIPDATPGRSDTDATWQDAMEGRLPDDPAALRDAAHAHAATAPLGVLQELIDQVQIREREEPDRPAHEWRGVRGALHQTLALRGSRVALYDLRESLAEATDPLPPSFIAALHAIGDESCLDGVAAAYETTDDARFRAQLRDAFHAIVRREHLTRRTATMKRLASKRPAAFRELTG